jgi:hypothetical protein
MVSASPSPGRSADGSAGDEAGGSRCGSAGAALRLADQLHTLAEVSETLTYRLLELEERLQLQERHRIAQGEPETGARDALGRRLGETEQRLERIEALLAGLEEPAGGRHLQVIGAGAGERHAPHPSEEEDLDNPFFEEGEQPFMDERTA